MIYIIRIGVKQLKFLSKVCHVVVTWDCTKLLISSNFIVSAEIVIFALFTSRSSSKEKNLEWSGCVIPKSYTYNKSYSYNIIISSYYYTF